MVITALCDSNKFAAQTRDTRQNLFQRSVLINSPSLAFSGFLSPHFFVSPHGDTHTVLTVLLGLQAWLLCLLFGIHVSRPIDLLSFFFLRSEAEILHSEAWRVKTSLILTGMG